MNINHERIEEFLKGMVPPEYTSDEHRRRLRGQILARLESESGRKRAVTRWRIIVLLAGLVCTGVAATEIIRQARRYYFEGRARDGSYRFATEPEKVYERTYRDGNGTHHSYSVSIGRGSGIFVDPAEGDLDRATLEQHRKDLEEVDGLRQQNARELAGVTDTYVNGKSLGRTFSFRYVLADGRTRTIGESSVDSARNTSPAQMERDQQEIADLRARGQRELGKIIETEFEGGSQRVLIWRYVFGDGREISVGEGDPGLPKPVKVLTPEQNTELSRLASLGQGEFLGTVQAEVYGRPFTFRSYAFRLSDGTAVIRSEGEPEGPKSHLTGADWKELRELARAHQAETLGTYDEEVMSTLFTFTCVKYVLSDGTVVIQSHGVPAGQR